MLRASRSLRILGCCAARKSTGFLNATSSVAVRRQVSNLADISTTNFGKITTSNLNSLRPLDTFPRRHLGPNKDQVQHQLESLGYKDLAEFVEAVVPQNVLVRRPLKIQPQNGFTESEFLDHLKKVGSKNKYKIKSFIGKGYYGTIVPPVIQRNLFESPEWYTSYTPYQPEISQGRLESLLNYQTVVSDLTGLPVANASLLDEGTAAAEAMILSHHFCKGKKNVYVVDSNIHPQTLGVLKSRASTLNIELKVMDLTKEGPNSIQELKDSIKSVCGILAQYPSTDGSIYKKFSELSDLIHKEKGLFAVATDLLALTLIKPPSTFGADIALGSSQRFGVPLGYGGPHAGFLSVIQSLNRKIPGRIVGVSKDRLGNKALRLALQTREQHIKREKATSNICTAQALLANMASNYAVYHGPTGLKQIAERILMFTNILASAIREKSSFKLLNKNWFDTLTIDLNSEISADEFLQKAVSNYNMNLFKVDDSTVSLSLDETVTESDLKSLIELFIGSNPSEIVIEESSKEIDQEIVRDYKSNPYLINPVFNNHHSETSMMRYLHNLQSKDLSLADSMISLGSCTMKLNSAVEMIPVSWPEFNSLHPFVPKDQAVGYSELIKELEKDLTDITGFDGVTLMPNSGAQGEYTGLTVIKNYLNSIGESKRNICLIPVSAHGTNPASSAMAGLKVIAVKCKEDGSLNLEDLKLKAEKYSDTLAAIMITYPSTYGLFEPGVRDAIDIVHANGGQVYLDGANMNAQVGLTSPGDLGADVCHLNLHKTFSIPHGGGGPGVGPICVKNHLIQFLPNHPVIEVGDAEHGINPVSSAPYGSASILPISYAYIKLMGATGLPYSSSIAMLNANYMMKRLSPYYEIMFVGKSGLKHCAHEFMIDLRKLKPHGVEAIDVAKRLQDYGFHSPTMSFPVANTLMVEPTESENLAELDRFVDSMIQIRAEIDAKINGDPLGNVLNNAPHTIDDLITSKDWDQRGYSRETAGYPLPHLKEAKSWPTVCRVNDTYGDTHLLCTCPSVEEVAEES